MQTAKYSFVISVTLTGFQNKKLSCPRETARRFVSLNSLLNHSRSFEMTLLSRACVSLALVFHWNYVSMSHRFRDIQCQKTGWTWKWGRGRSRSLKTMPFAFDRSYTTFYWSAIVSIAVCCTIFKLFDVKSSWPWKGHWRSFRLVPFESLSAVSYSPSIVTMAVSLTVYEIFSVKV